MAGHVRVLVGAMFSGKTEGLIDAVHAFHGAVRVYRPHLDVRAPGSAVVSHAGRSLSAIWCDVAMTGILPGGLVAVDEAQFLGPQAVGAVARLRECDTTVLLAGLDLDYLGRPFGAMHAFCALADEVIRCKQALCLCGDTATHSHRKVVSAELVLCGGADLYEPMCFTCWEEAHRDDMRDVRLPAVGQA